MKTMNLDSSVINEKKRKKPRIDPEHTPEEPVQSQEQRIQKDTKKEPFFKRLVSVPAKFAAWFKCLTPIQKVFVTAAVCFLIAGIGGIISYILVLREGSTDTFTIPDMVPAVSASSSYSTSVPISEPNPPRDQENPINGELYTKQEFEEMSKRYPIAVIIENHIDARPQSGYNSADLVFETLAEGGITRTMAIFWGRSVTEIGPVRSARQYFLEWLLPFDPLFMHIGQAYSDDPRIDANGNIYLYGIKSLDRYGTFWRSQDRYAPHNAYTSTELMYQKAEDYGYTGTPSEIDAWTFKQDAPADQRGQDSTVNLVFFERLNNGGIYDITWKYDRERNVYLRYNNENEYTDAITDTQVYAKNIIIQRVETISSGDYKAHMIITTIGEGDAIILRDGAVIYGTWKKPDKDTRTRYFDADGNEIIFNRGITWVEAVPIDQGAVEIDS